MYCHVTEYLCMCVLTCASLLQICGFCIRLCAVGEKECNQAREIYMRMCVCVCVFAFAIKVVKYPLWRPTYLVLPASWDEPLAHLRIFCTFFCFFVRILAINLCAQKSASTDRIQFRTCGKWRKGPVWLSWWIDSFYFHCAQFSFLLLCGQQLLVVRFTGKTLLIISYLNLQLTEKSMLKRN